MHYLQLMLSSSLSRLRFVIYNLNPLDTADCAKGGCLTQRQPVQSLATDMTWNENLIDHYENQYKELIYGRTTWKNSLHVDFHWHWPRSCVEIEMTPTVGEATGGSSKLRPSHFFSDGIWCDYQLNLILSKWLSQRIWEKNRRCCNGVFSFLLAPKGLKHKCKTWQMH